MWSGLKACHDTPSRLLSGEVGMREASPSAPRLTPGRWGVGGLHSPQLYGNLLVWMFLCGRPFSVPHIGLGARLGQGYVSSLRLSGNQEFTGMSSGPEFQSVTFLSTSCGNLRPGVYNLSEPQSSHLQNGANASLLLKRVSMEQAMHRAST